MSSKVLNYFRQLNAPKYFIWLVGNVCTSIQVIRYYTLFITVPVVYCLHSFSAQWLKIEQYMTEEPRLVVKNHDDSISNYFICGEVEKWPGILEFVVMLYYIWNLSYFKQYQNWTYHLNGSNNSLIDRIVTENGSIYWSDWVQSKPWPSLWFSGADPVGLMHKYSCFNFTKMLKSLIVHNARKQAHQCQRWCCHL